MISHLIPWLDSSRRSLTLEFSVIASLSCESSMSIIMIVNLSNAAKFAVSLVIYYAMILLCSVLQVQGSPLRLPCGKSACDALHDYCDTPSASCLKCEDDCSSKQARSDEAQSSCNNICEGRICMRWCQSIILWYCTSVSHNSRPNL